MRLGRAVLVPGKIAAALELVFGERIDQVRVIEYSLFARLHACNHATTRRRRMIGTEQETHRALHPGAHRRQLQIGTT